MWRIYPRIYECILLIRCVRTQAAIQLGTRPGRVYTIKTIEQIYLRGDLGLR